MRKAKFQTIAYGEAIPQTGSIYDKTDCLIVIQKEENGTEVDLKFADGNGKVVELKTLQKFKSGTRLSFDTKGEQGVQEMYFDDNGGLIIVDSRSELEDSKWTTILAGNGGVSIKKAYRSTIVGQWALSDNEDKDTIINAVTVIGSQALKNFKGIDDSLPYNKTNGQIVHKNIMIGYGAGQGLVEGGNNIFIGDSVGLHHSNNRPYVLFNKLMIHSSKYPGTDPERKEIANTSTYPLIYGDFAERWFQLAGQHKVTKHHNPLIDINETNEVAVFKSDNNYVKTLSSVNKIELVKNVLLSDELTFTPEEQSKIKQKLGINV